MTRFARIRRPNVAAVLVAAVSAALPACQSIDGQSHPPFPAYQHPPFPPAAKSAPAPAAAPAGGVIQVQGRAPAGGKDVPTDIAPGQPANLAAPRLAVPTAPPGVPGVPPGAIYAPAPGGPLVPAGGDGGSFWSDPRGGRGPTALDRFRGFDPADAAARPDWQNLPRLLGDQGRNSAGGNAATDAANGSPGNFALIRDGVSAAPGGGTASNHRVGVEAATPDRMKSFGATAGVQTQPGGAAGGLAPSLYAKRVVASSEDGMVGFGLGGTLPAGTAAQGNIFPWVFCASRVTGDTWLQGITGVSIPFTSSDDTFGYADYGLVIPVYGQGGDRGAKVYFIPELHANFLLSRGSDASPGFVLNSTVGFGARVGAFDVQAGMAFPLLSERFYDYESIMRVSYWF